MPNMVLGDVIEETFTANNEVYGLLKMISNYTLYYNYNKSYNIYNYYLWELCIQSVCYGWLGNITRSLGPNSCITEWWILVNEENKGVCAYMCVCTYIHTFAHMYPYIFSHSILDFIIALLPVVQCFSFPLNCDAQHLLHC